MSESIATPEKPMRTVAETAKAFGVSERTVAQMIADRKLRSFKVAGARRIAQADIDEYLAAHQSA